MIGTLTIVLLLSALIALSFPTSATVTGYRPATVTDFVDVVDVVKGEHNA